MEDQRDCASRAAEQGVMGDDGRTPQAGEGNLGQDGEIFFFLDPKAAEREVKMRRSNGEVRKRRTNGRID